MAMQSATLQAPTLFPLHYKIDDFTIDLQFHRCLWHPELQRASPGLLLLVTFVESPFPQS